ncbi:MAG: transposase family protein [Coleofasciculaceae cyanobacterium]
MPNKKPPNGELNSQQKETNKKLSSKRIFVEHVIRLVKILKIAQERFRLDAHKNESIIMTICGLVRLRIGRLVFQAVKIDDDTKTIEVNNLLTSGSKLTTMASNTDYAVEIS